jgi:TFIIF-interacting CTD phosphatase-like protein
VLDLDETLILSGLDPSQPHDETIELSQNGKLYRMYVNLRPWVHYFLKEAAKYYEIAIFTAAEVN